MKSIYEYVVLENAGATDTEIITSFYGHMGNGSGTKNVRVSSDGNKLIGTDGSDTIVIAQFGENPGGIYGAYCDDVLYLNDYVYSSELTKLQNCAYELAYEIYDEGIDIDIVVISGLGIKRSRDNIKDLEAYVNNGRKGDVYGKLNEDAYTREGYSRKYTDSDIINAFLCTDNQTNNGMKNSTLRVSNDGQQLYAKTNGVWVCLGQFGSDSDVVYINDYNYTSGIKKIQTELIRIAYDTYTDDTGYNVMLVSDYVSKPVNGINKLDDLERYVMDNHDVID